MKAVMAFSSKAASFASAAFSKGKAALASKGGGDGEGPSGKQLGGMSRGVSAVGSLMEYAGARQQAASMDQSARDEAMAARGEYIQASEKVSAIDSEYNALVGQQLVAASSMGIDAGSGSVIAAREAAQTEADRERNIIRNSAETNARLRYARSLNLREAAKNARFGATLKLGMEVGQAIFGGR
ncbi:hypothetical protein NI454_09205 [Brevundimonas diminuta]|uniref:Uncharacterized protein n=2 Tax=Brevundimonas vancanneytii TaxID=1325724 RepID=A0A4P1K213_9CAUL|nr:hypothetical protein [Brevundimonas diminuta]MCO8030128.1 hypothetical protein [Brevundimonas diminuta]VTO14074.1 Uncharacterised protein [Brevundimonas vancanneytii]